MNHNQTLRNLTSTLILIFAVLSASSKVILGFKGENAASVGIYVKDINSGKVVASNCETMAMSPASVMKAITAASVYTTLNSNFRFETKVYLTGGISDGICYGDLVITSCGDPTIDSQHFDDRPTLCQEITDALIGAGIKEIKGTVVVEESLLDAGCIPQWEVDDVPWSYGAGLFGFNYNDNTFTLWPATRRSEPHVPGMDIRVVKGKYVNLKRGIDSNRLIVYGPRPGDKNWRVNTTMNNPAESFAYELCAMLKDNDITVSKTPAGAAEADRVLLFVHTSPALIDMLSETLVYSHNMFAEGMLRTLAPDSTREEAVNRELQLWADRGLDIQSEAIIDGSGLSRANRLQPQFIGNVLEWMAKSEWADDYVSMFPIVGVNGTVKSFLKATPLAGQLVLKTGSMNAVQCYAGYKLDASGKPSHVVVILVNAFYCERAQLRKSIENFLLKTFP